MSTVSGTSSVNPYLQQYDNLQVYDTQELMNVSLGTPQNAENNVISVLAQWVALQSQEQAAQRQTIQSQRVPSLSDVIGQSDAESNSVLSQYAAAPPGSSIIDYQA